MHEPFKSYFLDPYSLLGFKPLWKHEVFKARCFRVHLSGAGFKSWECPLWDSNPSLIREKLRVLNFILTMGHRAQGVGFVVRFCASLSYLLWCGLSLLCLVPGFSFFFRWSCSVCSWRFSVFLEGGEFRILLCCYPELETWP